MEDERHDLGAGRWRERGAVSDLRRHEQRQYHRYYEHGYHGGGLCGGDGQLYRASGLCSDRHVAYVSGGERGNQLLG
jgi:hypothetical protein